MRDLKILNARIPCFDTEGWTEADLLVHQGKIQRIGTVTEDTAKTIDAAGKVVSPGFIDIHAHEDSIHAGEYAFFTALCELRMGVTTKAAGNCGQTNDSIADFCGHLQEAGSPTNYMMFVGQNTLRERVGALDRYKPSTRKELDSMKRLLEEAKAFSPVGLSCGFEYAPGVTAEETVELLGALGEEGYLTSVHFREDGEASVDSIRELIDISRQSGYGIQMSHIGSCSATGYMVQALDALKEARRRGVDIAADCYPYTALCTGIGTAVFDDGCFERWGKDYSAIQLTEGPHKNQRCDRELFLKIRREQPGMSVVAFVMNQEEIDLAYKEPFVMAGSDCGFHRGCGHPRGAGTYPRILGRYVRERRVLSLLDALRKMTAQPARRLKLESKGQVKEGFDADLVIFDPDIILDRADFLMPTEAPQGISWVILNGRVAVEGTRVVNGSLGRYIPYRNR